MAQEAFGANAPQMTAAEMSQWIQDHEKALKNFDAANNALKKLRDLTKTSTKRVNSLSKDRVIEFLQNPTANEGNLRNTSWYLMYRNMLYRRLIVYYSSLFYLDARSVIPPYDLIKPMSDEQMLKSYNDTLKMITKWNINGEFLKTNATCLIQDVSYNVAYYDETGLYLLPMPADYCRIYAQYSTGDFAYAINMSYFNGTNKWLVEAWGEPFVSMFREYEKNKSANVWQPVPDKYCCCFKYHMEDWQAIIPPFAGLFSDLINLGDIADNQAIADALDIYKLVYAKMKTISGAKMPDEFEVDPETLIAYGNRLIDEALPDYVTFGIIPGSDDLGVVDFSNIDRSAETTKVQKATKTVLNTSGAAQILNSADITGTTAFTAATRADELFAAHSLLPQINGWFNRILPFAVSNPSKIKFFDTGRFSKDSFRKELLENAQYSLPTKLAIMTMSGFDELDSLSLNHLEDNILKLGERFSSPLKSSHTSTGNDEGGRPVSDDGDLTDDGEASRDKSDRVG